MTNVASASPSTSSATINKRLALLHDRFEDRHEVLDAADLLLEDEHVGVFQNALHVGRIGHEVRREVALVELHPFDPFDFGFQALAFIHRDHAVFTNFFHRVSEQFTNLAIVVRGDRTDVRHVVPILDLDRHLVKLLGDASTAFSMPAFI